MQLPGRVFSSNKYRFGFNGKEKDIDITNGGQDYGMRIYSSSICRFLSTDPISKSFPWYTPFQFAGNKPIIAIDLDGLEELLRVNFFDETGKNDKALFIPLSTFETARVFSDIWADINGITEHRNWESSKIDRFTQTTAIWEGSSEDYAEGRWLKTKDNQSPLTGQLTINVNKPGTGFKYSISYSKELTEDQLYEQYHSGMIKTNLFEVGYLFADGLSNAGNFFQTLGATASVTMTPAVGAWSLAGGTLLSKTGDGVEIGLDYLRNDKDAANKKLLLYGVNTILDMGLGGASKLCPVEEQKIITIGATINTGSNVIKDQIKSNEEDKAKPRKSELIARSLEMLRNI